MPELSCAYYQCFPLVADCRRQGFWIAKQILQIGMGDAVDDWLVTQIQRLRQEDVVAGAIKSLQEV